MYQEFVVFIRVFFMLLAVYSGAISANTEFENWKKNLLAPVTEVTGDAMSAEQFINSLQYLPDVIEKDRRQIQGRISHEEYLNKVIPEWKVKKAREIFKKHSSMLKHAEEVTGVSPKFIVALWGKESNFGQYMGNYHVPSALATLAFDGRRGEFFTKELLAAAKIINEGHITSDEMLGSWAGAMGHCQFMPSTFLRYAVDANQDGKKDIWGDKSDIFMSMGNFLNELGWQDGRTWGRQVKLTRPFNEYKMGKKNKLPLSQWQDMGVRRYDLSDLPNANIKAYLIAPGGENGRIYLVYKNFDVLMKWNRSQYFATGVGYLADRIGYPKI